MTTARTIEVYADTRGPGRCSGCRAAIVWATVVKSGKKMCFDEPAIALTTRHEDSTRRLVEAIAFETNHWASCPASDQFKRR